MQPGKTFRAATVRREISKERARNYAQGEAEVPVRDLTSLSLFPSYTRF